MRSSLLLAAALGFAATTAQAAFLVTPEAAGLRNTTAGFSFVGVERFNALPTGTGQNFATDFGTTGQTVVITANYSNVQINDADVFGGDNNTRYAVTFSNPGYSLTLGAVNTVTGLATPVTYFGYWLSALDGQNQVQFFKGGNPVFSYTPSDVLARTGTCPDALNLYCGNPVPGSFQGGNAGEPYVFLNFFDLSGVGFDEVRFFQSPLGGGYESDNHTVGFFTSTNVPVPGALALFGVALLGLGMVRGRRT